MASTGVTRPNIYSAVALNEEFKTILQENYDVRICRDTVPTKQEMLQDVPGAHAIICMRRTLIDKEVIEAAGPMLKVVCTWSAGYNHIDLDECKRRKIRIGYLGPLIAGCMAEFTVGFMIQTARRGGWMTFCSEYLLGYEVSGSTVGIVGLGHIGQEVAKRLKVFNVKKILYTGPGRKEEGNALVLEYTTLNELLQQSDFIIATCALNEQTKRLFDREAFNLMKPSSIFINVSRGEVVDQEALLEALKTKKIFAAGLDVTTPEPLPQDHPLNSLENCVIQPHTGTAVYALRKQMYQVTIDNVSAGLMGRPMPSELFF